MSAGPASPVRACLQGQLQPAVHDAGGDRRGLGLQRRVPDGPLAGSQRLQRQLHQRGRHRPAGAELLEHKVFLSVGHDEYWSGSSARTSRRRATAGVHLAFFSGNEMFWKTRWEPASTARHALSHTGLLQGDARRTQDRPVAERVDGHVARSAVQPARRWRPPGERADRDDLHGELLLDDPHDRPRGGRQDALLAQHDGGDLSPGQVATLPDGTLGYEWDEDLDNGFRPAGLVRLSTRRSRGPVLQDYGSTYPPGTATSPRSRCTGTPSGALVFGAGTVQWSWGLDGNHDRRQRRAELAHAAGDRQPVRRHGSAAADHRRQAWPPRRPRATRWRRPRGHRLPANGGSVPENTTVTISGHGEWTPGTGSWEGSRCRLTGGDVAAGHGPRELDVHLADGGGAHRVSPQSRRGRQRKPRTARERDDGDRRYGYGRDPAGDRGDGPGGQCGRRAGDIGGDRDVQRSDGPGDDLGGDARVA